MEREVDTECRECGNWFYSTDIDPENGLCVFCNVDEDSEPFTATVTLSFSYKAKDDESAEKIIDILLDKYAETGSENLAWDCVDWEVR